MCQGIGGCRPSTFSPPHLSLFTLWLPHRALPAADMGAAWMHCRRWCMACGRVGSCHKPAAGLILGRAQTHGEPLLSEHKWSKPT
jgi:hypothetical protein